MTVAKDALAAFQAGNMALQADRVADAANWFDRAHRLAPQDLSVGLMLGVTWLRLGRATEAAVLLQEVAAGGAGREAWITLANALHDAGEPMQAAAALHRALAEFRLPEDLGFAAVADKIAAAAGYPGWCGLRADGGVEYRLADPTAKCAMALDGKVWRRSARLAVNAGPKPETDGASLAVVAGGQDLLGSPLSLNALRRCEATVAVRDGALEGWIWHPGDPDRHPVVAICGADGRVHFTVVADAPDRTVVQSLHRRRVLHVPAADLATLRMPLHVRASNGRDLPGSPLDPLASSRLAQAAAQAVATAWPLRLPAAETPALALASVPANLTGPPAHAKADPSRSVAVVIPVYGGMEVTQTCLAAVFATVPAGTAIIVVDDASPDPALVGWLDGLQRARRIRLIRHPQNRGFPAAANSGLRAAGKLGKPHDVVLLNSDAEVTPGWLEALRAVVHAAADIGSATPLSNDASILSYPKVSPAPEYANPILRGAELARIARQAASANPGLAVDIPTGVGFCLYLRHECLRATGVFREDVFAQGYGEENDFCLRARHLGWRHVGVPGVYVAHLGGQTFGASTQALITRNLAVLEAMHPGYHALIAAFERADPLAAARRKLDSVRWRDGRARVAKSRQALLLITHDNGGGVERVIEARCAALRAAGIRPIMLRPARTATGLLVPDLCAISDDIALTPNLRFGVPGELDALADLLKADGVTALEVHHLLGHNHMVLRLAALLRVPVDYHVHDYAMYCPRITLFGPDRRYCGEPSNPTVCDTCIADAGKAIVEDIAPTSLRARSANDLAAARRIVTPSADAAARLRRHFPGIAPVVVPLEDDSQTPDVQVPPQGARRKICVVGAIGPEKGYDVLLACARDAAARDLPLEFVLVGHSMDDQRLLQTGRVFITGRYEEAEAMALIAAQEAQIAWLPSIWPETWCFALTVAWQARLPVVAFDIGAQAERIRNQGQGWVLPLGLPPATINNTLLSLER